MSLAPRLDLRLKQSLAMTPQLQQAIKLLALSNLEIEAMIAETMERNPLLEVAEPGGVGDAGDGPVEAEPALTAADERAADEALAGSDWDESSLDTDWSAGSGEARIERGSSDGEAIDFDRFSAPDISLGEHLTQQARAHFHGPQLIIVLQLIDALDPAGYLDADMVETAARLGVLPEAVDAALAALQSLDPTGIGARDLAECIALQAKEANRYDPCMAALIANLDLVAKGRLKDLRRLCEVDDEDLMDMIRELRGYDPKPGLRFSSEAAATVTPDLFVTRSRGSWTIEINDATLPRLLVNRAYYTELRAATGKDAKSWLGDCLSEANGLIKALDQRQRSILTVAREVVKQQEGFFLHGVARMRALTLKQVADAVGLHESTVSRVTSNKYLACARGTFELKYFFSSGVGADSGDTASAEAVKSAIRTLIDGERADAILSDDTLVDLLKAKGFDIARRTVAKYREAMGLGSSVQRRRQKKLSG